VPESIIYLKNIYYRYPKNRKYSLEDINISASKGEFLAIMGAAGAGKTSFCRLINGIIPHIYGGSLSGTVTVSGLCTKDYSVPELAFKAGIVLDDPDAQIFTSTVYHEVTFGLQNILLPADEIDKRAESALYAVGLSGFEDRIPMTLSGGEKQKLAIAAALAMKSEILILDEPLSRLDPEAAAEVIAVLNEIREKFQITIVIASHNSSFINGYADRVCILNNGKVTAMDTMQKIFGNSALLEENGIWPPVKEAGFSADLAAYTEYSKYSGNSISANPVIEIKNLSFSYPGSECFKNLNLTVNQNDFAAIIGKNGCGKTTLLKIITGLLRPQNGEVFINGRNTKGLSISEISKEAGFVMQNPDNQLFTDSVYNEIAFALKNAHLSKKEIKQRVEYALKAVNLNDKDAFPHALNKPDRTKTVISCVLAMGCKIIILDEIDSSLDYNECTNIMNLLQDLNSRGFTIIFVTHNMTLAERYALRIIKL